MDRTGKIILGGSILLLVAAPILQTKFGPKPKTPVADASGSANGTNVAARGTNEPPVIKPAPVDGNGAHTNTAPVNSPTNAIPALPETGSKTPSTPEVKEETAVLENKFVKFTFTNRGGGVKKVEMKKYPDEINVKGGSRGVTGSYQTVDMVMDRGRLPLLSFEPSEADTDMAPNATRPYKQASAYTLTRSATEVVVTAQFGDWQVQKTFSIFSDYQLSADVVVSSTSTNTLDEVDFYLLSGKANQPLKASRMMGLNFASMWFNGDEEQKVDQGWFNNKPLGCMCMPGGDPRNNYQNGQGNVKWLGAYSRFFVQAVIPKEPGHSLNIHEFRLDSLSNEESEATGAKVNNNQMAWETALKVRVPSLEPKEKKKFHYTLYTGPKEYDRLKEIGRANGGNQFHRIMDFGKWFGWVAEGLLRLMKWMEPSLGFLTSIKISSWALSIICITLTIKLIFWPITAKSTRAMKKMAAVNQKMMPEITKIREKYKGDYQKTNTKMMEIYKKYGVNPLSQMGGCLPMLIQIPVFFGFFTMLRSAVELRGAEFLWASDLSSPDTIAMVAGFPINIMPLFMTGTMFLQMRLQPPSPGMDPTQQAMMKYMPLMFVVFFYSASSGLCLYWTVQNVLSIVQTKMTKVEPDKGNNEVEVIPPNKKRKKT